MVAEKQHRSSQANDRASRQPWREVSRLATTQRGYVSSAQLRAFGISRGVALNAIRDGRLFARPSGVYLVGHQYTPPDGKQIAALVAVGPDAVLSHRSAAEIWSLMRWKGDVDVTAAVRSGDVCGVVVHQGKLHPRHDVTHRHGFPVTTLLRTIVDLAAVLDEPRLAVAVNEAAIRGWLTKPFVRRLQARMVGRRGAVALRRILAARDVSKGWTRSKLENAFANLVREALLPAYERGEYVDIGDGDIRECDAMWRDRLVMVEVDFLPIHETGFVPYRDRRRDRRLTAAGWRVIRITPDDLTNHREEVIEDLRAALGLVEKQDRSPQANDPASRQGGGRPAT